MKYEKTWITICLTTKFPYSVFKELYKTQKILNFIICRKFLHGGLKWT